MFVPAMAPPAAPPPGREPLTPEDLALLLGVSEEVVLSWVEAGLLPHRREGEAVLFDSIALDRWLEEKTKALYGEDF